MIADDGPSITSLPEQVAALPDEDRERVQRLFSIVRGRGSLVPPPEMTAWIERSFGSVEAVQAQAVVKTLNRWTFEGSLFNSLRARRPMDRRRDGAGDQGSAGSGQDPFCHPLTGTPADTFGRIRGQHAITASNVAKYDVLHAVVIFDQHNPLELSAEQLTDALAVARRWLDAAHRAQPEAVYPIIMWNCLPRSGASIVHAHMQTALSEGCAYAQIELWRRAAQQYRAAHGVNYFDDLYAAHHDLGLASSTDSVRWFAHLTPVKEKELIVLTESLGDRLYAHIHRLLRVYIDVLGVRTYNLAIYLRPLAPVEEDWSDFPVVVRMVDRGDPGSATSDIAAMELFAQPVIASDPWRLAATVRETLGV
jgi:hypothetical protein